MHFYSSFVIPALAANAAVSALSTKQIFQFANSTFVENISIRPNGNLLLSTFDQGRLWTVDPKSPQQTQVIAQFPGANALSGNAQIGPDKFAFFGGDLNITNRTFTPGSLNVYTVDFQSETNNPTIKTIPNVAPDTFGLNGMASLPDCPHIILGADSIGGRIFRIDTDTGKVDIVIQDTALAVPTFENGTANPPGLGVNGIKVHQGHLYFTNSAAITFGRVPITPEGDKRGDLQIIAKIPASDTATGFDDFDVREHGVAFVTMHPRSLVRIEVGGKVEVVVGGESESEILLEPTSVSLVKGGEKLYVTTGGDVVDGKAAGGQVVEVNL